MRLSAIVHASQCLDELDRRWRMIALGDSFTDHKKATRARDKSVAFAVRLRLRQFADTTNA